MLSTVLRSKRAVQVNVEIMRAFVRLVSNPMNDLNGAKRLNDWNDWNGIRYLKRKYDAQFKLSSMRSGNSWRHRRQSAEGSVF